MSLSNEVLMHMSITYQSQNYCFSGVLQYSIFVFHLHAHIAGRYNNYNKKLRQFLCDNTVPLIIKRMYRHTEIAREKVMPHSPPAFLKQD